MSDALKFALVTGLAGLSAVVSAQTLVTVAHRAPEFRAAKAEAATPLSASPASNDQGSPGEIKKADDGHYWAEGLVNGSHIRFLVDTGASAVALTPADAERLGFDPAKLAYDYKVKTAGGEARGAAVKLKDVIVAGVRLENVDALVIDKGLDASLLGMTYLGRLASFEATRQSLVLKL